MASKNDKIRTPALATALAVLKGAIAKKIGAGVTSSFAYNSKTKGIYVLMIFYIFYIKRTSHISCL